MNYDWPTFLTSIGGSAVVGLGAAYAIVQTFFKKKIESEVQSKYDEALANLNAKNLQELEGFKTGYQKVLDENQIRFSWYYSEQAQVIKKLYSQMIELQQCALNIFSMCDKTLPKNAKQLNELSETEKFKEVNNNLHCYFYQNSIFFDDELHKNMQQFFDEINNHFFKETNKKNKEELFRSLSLITTNLKKDFRAILNGEEGQSDK